MKETRYFYCPNILSGELPKEEADHVVRVLRLQVGATVQLTDGKGSLYDAELTEISKKKCAFRVLNCHKIEKTWRGSVEMAVAPTKNIDRMEWFVEKATEIGIDTITFLNCQFSERRNINHERLERIAIAAMKQSHKAQLPLIHEMQDFSSWVQSQSSEGGRYIAHCYQDHDIIENVKKVFLMDALQKQEEQHTVILIGPEGDFSINEVKLAIQKDFIPVSLGQSRLRTETAALSALFMFNLKNRI